MADVPFVLAGIEPLSLLGSGGFGEVWLALQSNIDRKVAVKVGHTPIDDKTVQLRFERECIALGRLSGHPNIIDVFTAGQLDDGRPYLVLEYVSGGTLWQRSQKGPLTEAELLKVGIELADALHVAHTAGVLHRDLKPENVLLRSSGEAVLGDFGIARLHDGAHTSSHAITASVAYAPPEILSGMASSTASDLYGIGICLLAGGLRNVPFVEKADESVHPIINRVLSERPPDLSTLGFSAEMAALINTLLEKDPAKRPLSAEMVKQQLIELTLDGTSTSAAGQGADPTRPVAPPAASSGSQGPLGLPSIPTETGPVNRGWGEGDGPVISQPYVTSSSSETAALRPRTGWDRLRLFGAAFGATLLVGGLLIFALGRLGGDDDSADTSTSRSSSTTLQETTTTEEVAAPRSDPLVLPLSLADTDLNPGAVDDPDLAGPDSSQFCDNTPVTVGLSEWDGSTLADPQGFPLVFQQLARFDTMTQAGAYVDAYLGTIDCTQWTIPAEGETPEINLVLSLAQPTTTYGDRTEEVLFDGASGPILLYGRVAIIQSGAEVFTLSITSLTEPDLDMLDSLLELAIDRLGY